MVSNSNRIIKVIPDMKALAENVSGADRSKWDILDDTQIGYVNGGLRQKIIRVAQAYHNERIRNEEFEKALLKRIQHLQDNLKQSRTHYRQSIRRMPKKCWSCYKKFKRSVFIKKLQRNCDIIIREINGNFTKRCLISQISAVRG
ncbi:unnamed protein product [Paramecium octaurelia]|uniref:Uncharacterized protein n=1 Tax=Paramecium octaurelia TaxID=43137 RepID=A0A8S1VKR7_PAROT|nr:unnamed protein product [Paramecium octaurelia]